MRKRTGKRREEKWNRFGREVHHDDSTQAMSLSEPSRHRRLGQLAWPSGHFFGLGRNNHPMRRYTLGTGLEVLSRGLEAQVRNESRTNGN